MAAWFETAWQFLVDFWPHLLAAGVFVVELICSLHALLYKRDTRAIIGWVGLIWLTPLVGAILYVMFGVNRIQRRAKRLRGELAYQKSASCNAVISAEQLIKEIGTEYEQFQPLTRLIDQLAEQPLLQGNSIRPLVDGDEAYPAMIAVIERAKSSINLCSYIFDNDRAGKKFVDALAAAQQRGVQVQILLDDVGSRYTFPSIVGVLRHHGIRVERFMRTLLRTRFAYSNLRTHRKILVVDGNIGFTGGMNIRESGWHSLRPTSLMHDLHFECRGPVVAQLQESFAEDWLFTTGETLEGEKWFPAIEPQGAMIARGVPSGPDEDFGELRTSIMGALAVAKHRVAIVTPYFLPDDALIEMLNVTALRGITVDIVLPQTNNLRLVQWACMATLPQVLERGCRVWLNPGCFDHTKLLVIDDIWTLFGSANWDSRSFRLNFEYNVECYDRDLAKTLLAMVEKRIAKSERVTHEMLAQRPFWKKIRDGVARLLTPYL